MARSNGVSFYQTPDGERDSSGHLLRPQARYNDSRKYDMAQQDNLVVLPSAPDMTAEDFRSVFSDIGARFQSMQGSGTTASATHISTQGILTVANIGDSPVNIYLRDPKTGDVFHEKTVSSDHNAHDPAEAERVIKAGGQVIGGRVCAPGGGSFALSRAFGDNEIPGITHTPDVKRVDLKPYFKQGFEIIVTTESDGAFENTDHAARERLMRDTLRQSGGAQNLAHSLARLADKNGSTDNISSAAIVLKSPPKENILAAVFDGHGPRGGTAASIGHLELEANLKNFAAENRVEEAARHRTRAPADAGEVIAKAAWINIKRDSQGREARYVDIGSIGAANYIALENALRAQGIEHSFKKSSLNGRMDVLYVTGDAIARVEEIQDRFAPPQAPARQRTAIARQNNPT